MWLCRLEPVVGIAQPTPTAVHPVPERSRSVSTVRTGPEARMTGGAVDRDP